MKNDIYLTLEKRDLEIREELEFGDDLRHIEAYVETRFDVDRKFGLRTAANDDAWVNLYARYNPVPSQQKWTQKSLKKRNESQYFLGLRKLAAFIPRFT